MRYLIFAQYLILIHLGLAQEAKELRHEVTASYSADFYIRLEDKKIKYADTLYYAWFKSQKVHITQGYSSGYLLHGSYQQYYVSGQLAQSGQYATGLKNGEWKTWYESGQLKSLYSYDNGVLEGSFYCYDESGKITESGTYKSGRFHGDITENGEVTEYRNGKRKEKKVKEDSETDKPQKEPKPKEDKKESSESDQQDSVDGDRRFSIKTWWADMQSKRDEKRKNRETGKPADENKEKEPKDKKEKDKKIS